MKAKDGGWMFSKTKRSSKFLCFTDLVLYNMSYITESIGLHFKISFEMKSPTLTIHRMLASLNVWSRYFKWIIWMKERDVNGLRNGVPHYVSREAESPAIPQPIHLASTLYFFKAGIKTFLFERAFGYPTNPSRSPTLLPFPPTPI